MSETSLPQSSLGRTGLSVTKLGYGAMEVRGPRIWRGRPVEDAEADQILNAVVDNGITFIDTANDYGRSEEYIGRFLSHLTGAVGRSASSRCVSGAPPPR